MVAHALHEPIVPCQLLFLPLTVGDEAEGREEKSTGPLLLL